MRAFAVLIAALVVSGCASGPKEPPSPLAPAPVCFSAGQCDAMWAEAITQIQNISGMRLQVATETFMQTYPVPRSSLDRLEANAKRQPNPDGSTTIEAEFSCSFCGNLPYQALNLFTSSVKRAGAGFPGPTASKN